MNRVSLLVPFARKQLGLVTFAQAVETGMSSSTWFRCLDDGRLEYVHPCVARMPGSADSTLQRILAGVLAVDAGALSSHASSAFVWLGEVPNLQPTDPVHVIGPRTSRLRLPGVMVHRPLDRSHLDVVTRQQVPTTKPLRMIVDAGAVVSLSTLAAVVDRALVRRLCTFEALGEAADRHGRRGRDGVGPLRLVLRDWQLGEAPPDSVLEVEVPRLFAAHGLPLPTFHPAVRAGGRLLVPDFGYLPERVLIEVDGWAYHGGRASFEDDRRRDALLAAEGWVVLRFTWFQITHEPLWVIDQVRAVLANRSAA